MKRIILIRHAQAADPLMGQKDFDRPLTARGLEDARKQSQKIELKDYPHLYYSSAQRTTETALQFAAAFPLLQLQPRKELYNADLDQLLDIIEELWDLNQVVLVGHNPGITQLYFHLTGEWENFETCTFAELEFSAQDNLQNIKNSAHTIYLSHP